MNQESPHTRPPAGHKPESQQPEWQQRRDEAAVLVGATEVSQPLALFAVVVLGLVMLVVPAVQIFRGGVGEALAAAARGVGAATAQLPSSPRAANATAIATLTSLEDRLEEDSPLVAEILPATRLVGLSWLGVGSHDVIPATGGWLFWRPDLAAVLAPDPLSPASRARHRRFGRHDRDPLPAILALRDDLGARGIELLVLLAPVKPELEVTRLLGDGEPSSDQVRVAGQETFTRELAAAGVPLLDPADDLRAAAADGTPVFLRTDTHWSPEAVELVARRLAERLAVIEPALGTASSEGAPEPVVVRRRVVGEGDLLRLLRLPAGAVSAAEVVEVEALEDPSAWVGEGASVLLLGDSFAGVFSRPELGWGRGAGLAERLAVHSRQRVDLLAVNAGGARGSRERLVAELSQDPERLDGVKIVVWELAARELLLGEWPVIPLGN